MRNTKNRIWLKNLKWFWNNLLSISLRMVFTNLNEREIKKYTPCPVSSFHRRNFVGVRIRHKYRLLNNSDQSADSFRWCCPSFMNSSRTPNESALSEGGILFDFSPFEICKNHLQWNWQYSHININRFSRKTFRRPWTATFKLRLCWNINYVCFVMFVSLLYLLVGVLLSFRIQ